MQEETGFVSGRSATQLAQRSYILISAPGGIRPSLEKTEKD